jgi:glucose-1-phosphate thymidylyltransferase
MKLLNVLLEPNISEITILIIGDLMKGIILAGGTGSRLFPATKAISKQLLPVYDKPMIYYPLSTLMLLGIQDIAVITRSEDQYLYQKLLGDGFSWGLNIEYMTQDEPNGIAEAFVICADFISNDPCVLILGDNIFAGPGLGKTLDHNFESRDKVKGAQVFAIQVAKPQDYGIINFDSSGIVQSIEEKPLVPKSRWAVPGIYFVDSSATQKARSVKPSSRGEKEITSLLEMYLSEGSLQAIPLPRGSVWLDMGQVGDLSAASEYVRNIFERQGLMIGSPEEIAWRNGWINSDQLTNLGEQLSASKYGQYLLSLVQNSN